MAGFDDKQIRGFDSGIENYDDSIDKLDIYAKFLGETEYLKIKDNYYKALGIMDELHNIERDRLHMNAPCQYSDLLDLHSPEILERFHNVHETYLKSGKSREKYMQRIEIEFKRNNISKAQIELIDSFFEHKRWLRQKEKIMSRDLIKDRLALKERTVNMIEGQVEEQRIKLQLDMKNVKMGAKKEDLHGKLAEQKEEYNRNMSIIQEIKRDKERQATQEATVKEKMNKEVAQKNKYAA